VASRPVLGVEKAGPGDSLSFLEQRPAFRDDNLMDTAFPTAATRAEETQTTMQVRKRNGSLEPVDINKIVRAISRCTAGLPNVDVMRIATKTISGLYDGATTQELDKLSIQTAASLIFEEPEYSRVAARLLNQYVE
jgi:ribonucleoside-diphosphate reductase alpha chain